MKHLSVEQRYGVDFGYSEILAKPDAQIQRCFKWRFGLYGSSIYLDYDGYRYGYLRIAHVSAIHFRHNCHR